MRLQIEATEFITEIDGVAVRCWNGITVEGVPCFVFVHRIAVSNEYDQEAFERSLQEQMPPVVKVPLPFIL